MNCQLSFDRGSGGGGGGGGGRGNKTRPAAVLFSTAHFVSRHQRAKVHQQGDMCVRVYLRARASFWVMCSEQLTHAHTQHTPLHCLSFLLVASIKQNKITAAHTHKHTHQTKKRGWLWNGESTSHGLVFQLFLYCTGRYTPDVAFDGTLDAVIAYRLECAMGLPRG